MLKHYRFKAVLLLALWVKKTQDQNVTSSTRKHLFSIEYDGDIKSPQGKLFACFGSDGDLLKSLIGKKLVNVPDNACRGHIPQCWPIGVAKIPDGSPGSMKTKVHR